MSNLQDGIKTGLFSKELKFIKDPIVREFTELAINLMPDYFFEVPASSTGKYHPAYALGNGGLLRHTRAAVGIAECMFGNTTVTGNFNDFTKDCIISALILHDGLKSGLVKQDYTVADHAKQMASHLYKNLYKPEFEKYTSIVVLVCDLISSHMGQWNTDRDGNIVSPLPSSGAQRYVHMCDYLASRKILEFNFNS